MEFDSSWGHRRDYIGYGKGLEDFDVRLKEVMDASTKEDIIFINADHGCDPTFKGTDHTREYVPMLIYGEGVRPGVNLGTRESFADIAATISKIIRIPYKTRGKSFWDEVKNG